MEEKNSGKNGRRKNLGQRMNDLASQFRDLGLWFLNKKKNLRGRGKKSPKIKKMSDK